MIKKLTMTALAIFCGACSLDVGKHLIIKNHLTTLLLQNPNALQYRSFDLKFIPFKSHLKMDTIKTASGGTIDTLTIRQPFFEFRKLTLNGQTVKFKTLLQASTLKVKFTVHPDIYKMKDDSDAHVECRHFILTDVALTLPGLTLTSPKLDSPWEYNLAEKTFKIAIKPSVLNINNENPFSINGKGDIQMIDQYPDGHLLINIKGIPTVIESLKKSGVMTDLQARLLLFGTGLMTNDQSEVPLNLSIKNKIVSLGPLSLFELD